MSRSLLIVLAIFCISAAPAKVKIKKKTIGVSVTQFPEKMLDPSIQTFRSGIISKETSIWRNIFNQVDLEREYLNLDGYQRTSDGGDVQIQVNIGFYKETKSEVEEALKSLKGGTGPDNKKYRYKIAYNMPVSYTVIHQSAVIHKYGAIGNTGAKTMYLYSPYYDTKAKAAAGRSKSLRAWQDDAKREYLSSKMKAIYNDLNDRYGYKPVVEALEFQHTNSKKNPEYDDLVDQVTELEGYLGIIAAAANIDDYTRNGIKAILDIWETESRKYKIDNDDTGKLKEAYLTNLMNGAYAIEDYDLSTKYANALMANKKTMRDGKRRLEKIEAVQVDFKRTGYTSRHLEFEVEDVAPVAQSMTGDSAGMNESAMAGDVDEIRRTKLNLHSNAKEHVGEFTFNDGGKRKFIVIVDHSRHSDFIFYSGTNFKLYTEIQDEYELMRFDLRKTKEFIIDDRQFVRFGKNNEIIELIYDTEKIDLYKAHPLKAEASMIQMTGVHLMQREGEGITDLRGLKFINFKKGFAKWISDCPALAEKVSDQKYKRKESDLIAIADEYNACQ